MTCLLLLPLSRLVSELPSPHLRQSLRQLLRPSSPLLRWIYPQ